MWIKRIILKHIKRNAKNQRLKRENEGAEYMMVGRNMNKNIEKVKVNKNKNEENQKGKEEML